MDEETYRRKMRRLALMGIVECSLIVAMCLSALAYVIYVRG